MNDIDPRLLNDLANAALRWGIVVRLIPGGVRMTMYKNGTELCEHRELTWGNIKDARDIYMLVSMYAHDMRKELDYA